MASLFGNFVAAAIILMTASVALANIEKCVYKEKALVVAFLALHSGENCDLVLQRGAQQIAALQLARDTVNANRGNLPELDIKVFDTCSSAEQAVKATLKALVQAQQGCKGPLFLGLLGPDDQDSLRAVSKVISVFQYPHVVSSVVRSFSQFGTTNVAVSEPLAKAKGLRTLLNELNWKSFYMAFTPDPVSTQIAAALLNPNEFCIMQTVQRIPLSRDAAKDIGTYNRLLYALQQAQHSRVLIISEDSDSAASLMNHLQSVASKTKFIVRVQGAGILPWKLSPELANNTMIVHETSNSGLIPPTFKAYLENSPLWIDYKNQTCEGTCENFTFIEEETTRTLTMAVHLFKEALKNGQEQKCRPGTGVCSQLANLPSNEWRNILEGTSVTVRDNDGIGNHKLRFRMILDENAVVFAMDSLTGRFRQIGVISDDLFSLRSDYELPIVPTSRILQCSGEIIALTTERPHIRVMGTPISTSTIPLGVDIFGIDVQLGKLSFYELVAVLTGMVFGMVLVILIMICLVYRCFRVKTRDTFSSPSNASVDLPPKKKKTQNRRRSFFRNSSRSVHTVQE